MKDIFLNIPLDPVPASRPKVTRQGYVYYGKNHTQFQKDIKQLFAIGKLKARKNPIDAPVTVSTKFFVPIAKSTSKKKREELDNTPCTKYDLDNLAKILWDEVLSKKYITDDSLIWSANIEKKWTKEKQGWIELDIYL